MRRLTRSRRGFSIRFSEIPPTHACGECGPEGMPAMQSDEDRFTEWLNTIREEEMKRDPPFDAGIMVETKQNPNEAEQPRNDFASTSGYSGPQDRRLENLRRNFSRRFEMLRPRTDRVDKANRKISTPSSSRDSRWN